MSIFQQKTALEKACAKELDYVFRQEAKLAKKARKDEPKWKTALAEKVPEKVRDGLQSAFGKAFALVFEKGTGLLEKTYNKNELLMQHQVQNYAIKLTESRKELKNLRKSIGNGSFRNAALTTVEGVGLGALGIGLPDAAVFIAVLLRGAYEAALQYGYDYESPREQLLILTMMEAALARGEEWTAANAAVDTLLADNSDISPSAVSEQMRRTADAFAVDMLVMKFIQGMPVVGIAGGLSNPVYYQKIMTYIQLKYYKRYLMKLVQ